MEFSDYIVYVDESGDHGLATLDPHYPLFVLAFCIFAKHSYAEQVVPAVQKLKFRQFGHDLVILHEHEIRKETGDFACFRNRQEKMAFLEQLTTVIEQAEFSLVACVIEKQKLLQRYQTPSNPYHLALAFGPERVYRYLQAQGQGERVTHIVVERRGRKEDDELELEFRRICDGANWFNRPLPLAIRFADKKTNSAGLQLADMVARPIGMSILRPEQPNRAYDVLRCKLYGGAEKKGWGLKCFP